MIYNKFVEKKIIDYIEYLVGAVIIASINIPLLGMGITRYLRTDKKLASIFIIAFIMTFISLSLLALAIIKLV